MDKLQSLVLPAGGILLLLAALSIDRSAALEAVDIMTLLVDTEWKDNTQMCAWLSQTGNAVSRLSQLLEPLLGPEESEETAAYGERDCTCSICRYAFQHMFTGQPH